MDEYAESEPTRNVPEKPKHAQQSAKTAQKLFRAAELVKDLETSFTPHLFIWFVIAQIHNIMLL